MPSSPGSFSYPPPGSNLQFNCIDSVVASWVSFDANATDCDLQLWYWNNANPWLMASNQSAPANGTAIVPLDFADGSYLGQLNIFYTDSNGGREKFVGPLFNVYNSPQSKEVTWSSKVKHTHSTASASASLQASIMASVVTSSTSQTTVSASLRTTIPAPLTTSSTSPATTTMSSKSLSVSSSFATASPPSLSKPSSTTGSALGAGSTAAIVLGIVCAGILAALIFYRLRKPNPVLAEVKAMLPAHFQRPIPANFFAEKDGCSVRLDELSGDSQLSEMASGDRLNTRRAELGG